MAARRLSTDAFRREAEGRPLETHDHFAAGATGRQLSYRVLLNSKHIRYFSHNEKTLVTCVTRVYRFLAEMEGFEPSIRFWRMLP